MFQFLGYHFFGGAGALDSAPSEIENIGSTKLSNAIFDHFNVTKDTGLPFVPNKPEGWTYDTILNSDFNGNISAGNLEYAVSNISGIKIKRRVKGTFNWLTLKYIPIDGVDSLIFTVNDFLNAYGVEYDYAFVPIVNGDEGDYIMDSVYSKFNGVFIGNSEESYKFLYDVQYGSHLRNQQTGTFTPLGGQYPIIVSNGMLNYNSGSVSGTILNKDFENSGRIDRQLIVSREKKIVNFLTNKKPKILKDWNGNLWMVMVNDNVNIGYAQGSGMGIPNVQFNWTEIGDSNNNMDLYNAGLTDSFD